MSGSGGTAADALTRVGQLRWMHRLRDAEQLCRRVLTDRPGDRAAQLMLVQLLHAMDRFAEAEQVLGDSDGDDMAWRAERILLVEHQRQPRRSGVLAEEAEPWLTVDGDADGERELRSALASVWAARGQLRRALHLVTPAGRTGLAGGPVLQARLELLLRLSVPDHVRAATQEVIGGEGEPLGEQDEDLMIAQINRLIACGRALGRIGDVQRALSLLECARDCAERLGGQGGVWYAPAWQRLATVYRINGRVDDARETLRQACQPTRVFKPVWGPPGGYLMADHPGIRIETAMQHMSHFDGSSAAPVDAALAELERVCEPGDAHTMVPLTRAQILRRAGRLQALRALHDKAVAEGASPDGVDMLRLELAHGLVEHRRRRADALALYDQVPPHAPLRREALLGKALVLADAQDPTQPDDGPAVDAAVDAICRELPEDVVVAVMTAERLAQRGHYRTAHQLFDRALCVSPDSGLTWAAKVRALAWQRDFRGLRQMDAAFKRLAATHANLPRIRYMLACALVQGDQLRYRQALMVFRDAAHLLAKRQQTTPGILDDLAVALAMWESVALRWQGRLDEAGQVVEHARLRYPYATALAEEHGHILLARSQPAEALTRFDEALRLRPQALEPQLGRIRALHMLGRHDQAILAAHQAKVFHPDQAMLRVEAAEVHMDQHQYEYALAEFDEALATEPGNPHALAGRARCLAQCNRHQKAEQAAALAWKRRPEHPDVAEAVCVTYLKQGNRRRARDIAQQLWNREDDQAVRTIGLSIMVRAGGDSGQEHSNHEDNEHEDNNGREADGQEDTGDEQVTMAEQLFAANRHAPEIQRIAISVMRYNLRFPQARHAAADAIDAHPHPHAIGLLGELAELDYAEGDFDAAFERIEACRAAAPDSWHLLRRHAEMKATTGAHREAIELLQGELRKRSAAFPDAATTGLRIALGETLLHAGDAEAASRIAHDLCQQAHPSIRARVLQVRAVRATGAVEEAAQLARKLCHDHPHSRRAQLALARSLEDIRDYERACAALTAVTLRELPIMPAAHVAAALIHQIAARRKQPPSPSRTALQEALNIISHGLAFAPQDAGLLAQKAWLVLDAGEDRASGEQFARLARRPDVMARALGHTGLGWLHLKDGRQQQARAQFNKAIALRVNASDAYYGKTVSYLYEADTTADERERTELLHDGAKAADDLLSVEHTERALIAAGNIAYQQRRSRHAIGYYEQSIAVHPYAGGYPELAWTHLQADAYGTAMHIINQGLSHRRDDPILITVRGWTRLLTDPQPHRSGQFTKNASKDFADVLNTVGDTAVATKHYPLAALGLATALVHTSRWNLPTADNLLTQAMQALSNATRPGTRRARADIAAALARMLLRPWQRRHTTRTRVLDRVDSLIQQAEAAPADYLNNLKAHARQRRRMHRSWWRRIGPVSAILAIAALWFTSWEPLSEGALITATIALLVIAIAAHKAYKIQGLRAAGFLEVDFAAEPDTDTIRLPRQPLPDGTLPIMPHATVLSTDPVSDTWHAVPDRLGPAIGLLVTGFYANRDAYYPWRNWSATW